MSSLFYIKLKINTYTYLSYHFFTIQSIFFGEFVQLRKINLLYSITSKALTTIFEKFTPATAFRS